MSVSNTILDTKTADNERCIVYVDDDESAQAVKAAGYEAATVTLIGSRQMLPDNPDLSAFRRRKVVIWLDGYEYDEDEDEDDVGPRDEYWAQKLKSAIGAVASEARLVTTLLAYPPSISRAKEDSRCALPEEERQAHLASDGALHINPVNAAGLPLATIREVIELTLGQPPDDFSRLLTGEPLNGKPTYASIEDALWASPGEDLWTMTQDADLARMMRLWSNRGALMALDGGAGSWELLVDESETNADKSIGVWRRNLSKLQFMFDRTRAGWVEDAEDCEKLVDAKMLAKIRAWRDSKTYHAAHKNAFAFVGAVYRRWQHADTLPDGLAYATPEQLDADGRYIGAPNGVVDLDTGRLLRGAEARACLVTRTLPDDFEADAEHPDVDKLFAHLPADTSDYWLRCIAYALRGNPGRRILWLSGPPGSGKTTTLEAVVGALGDYAGIIPDRALTPYQRSGPQPELAAFTRKRLLVSSDMDFQDVSVERLKRISGADSFSWHDKYSNNLRQEKATATLAFASNDDSLNQGLNSNEGLAVRIYPIRFPAFNPEQLDLDLRRRLSLPDRRQALVAKIVRYAVFSRRPPTDIPDVAESRREAMAQAMTEGGMWIRQRVYAAQGRELETDDVWAAAVRDSNQQGGEVKAFGHNRQAWTKYVTETAGLPKTVVRKRNGRTVRVWPDCALRADTG